MKIVINDCYGGFSVSENFFKEYNIPYRKSFGTCYPEIEINLRTDPRLIEYIEKHGSKMASGSSACLIIEEIPKGTQYIIEEYDGCESILTKDEIAWKIAT